MWSLRLFLAVIVVLTPLVAAGQYDSQAESRHSGSKQAVALAKRYLSSIQVSQAFPSTGHGGKDVVYVGYAPHSSSKWKIVIVKDGKDPRLVSVSSSFFDTYFALPGFVDVDIKKDEQEFLVLLQGYLPRKTDDGQTGIGLYDSGDHQFYRVHVVPSYDSSHQLISYDVTYNPEAGIPTRYRDKLNEIICADAAITEPSKLPIKCPAQ